MSFENPPTKRRKLENQCTPEQNVREAIFVDIINDRVFHVTRMLVWCVSVQNVPWTPLLYLYSVTSKVPICLEKILIMGAFL